MIYIYIKIKNMFQETPEKECFDLAYKLSFVLHEGVMTRGYKGYVPWNTEKIRNDDSDLYKWGFSACSEPEGVTVMKRNAVFISSSKYTEGVSGNDIRALYNILHPYIDRNNLCVLFGLYELTANDSENFVSVKDIAEKCRLSADIVENALNNLPLQMKILDENSEGYRLEGKYMYIPSVLMLLLH